MPLTPKAFLLSAGGGIAAAAATHPLGAASAATRRTLPAGGVIPAALTPFAADLEVSRREFRRHLLDLAKVRGVTAIMVKAAPMYLPDVLQPRASDLWTTARMKRVVAAAAKHRGAIEITATRKLPTLPFLRLAKAAGVKFTFGTNGRTADVIGQLDYSLARARELKLTAADLFIPRS